jgi:hypothetical protein
MAPVAGKAGRQHNVSLLSFLTMPSTLIPSLVPSLPSFAFLPTSSTSSFAPQSPTATSPFADHFSRTPSSLSTAAYRSTAACISRNSALPSLEWVDLGSAAEDADTWWPGLRGRVGIIEELLINKRNGAGSSCSFSLASVSLTAWCWCCRSSLRPGAVLQRSWPRGRAGPSGFPRSRLHEAFAHGRIGHRNHTRLLLS